jgi:putative transposase
MGDLDHEEQAAIGINMQPGKCSGTAHMPHSYVSSIFHVVFSTKQRTQLIPAAAQARLWNYLAGIARNHHIQALAVGGTENHVHMLLAIPPDTALADAVRTLKANSSRLMRETSASFAWQEGYGAFSVSPSQLDRVKRYIANQAAHHAKHSYEEEFLAMLQAANLRVGSSRVLR